MSVFTKKINTKWELLRPKLPCALSGMCIEEVCDARIGMCVHVRVPLMHGRSRCRVLSCVAPAVGHFGLSSSLVLLLSEPLTEATGAVMPSVFL